MSDSLICNSVCEETKTWNWNYEENFEEIIELWRFSLETEILQIRLVNYTGTFSDIKCYLSNVKNLDEGMKTPFYKYGVHYNKFCLRRDTR